MGDDGHESSEGLISVEEALSELGVAPGNDQNLFKHKLSGGLTNDNVLVILQSNSPGIDYNHNKEKILKYVLRRFSSKTSQHLSYDRVQEYNNSNIAFNDKQIGAPVIGYVPPTHHHGGALALDFVEGETMNEPRIQLLCSSEKEISRLVETLKAIHKNPPLFKNEFDPFKARFNYEQQTETLSGRGVPWKGYQKLVQQLSFLQTHLAKSPESLVDCHNDLLSANFIDSLPHITVIDWELSGQAQPSWELGNFVSENGLDGNEAVIKRLITQYWGEGSSSSYINAKIKRAKLFSIVSKITWSAWGAVLHHLDKGQAFDYQSWCMERVTKAQTALNDQNSINFLCSD